MPGIPLEWRENCTYTGLAQWKEHLATNQGLLGVRISHPVPKHGESARVAKGVGR